MSKNIVHSPETRMKKIPASPHSSASEETSPLRPTRNIKEHLPRSSAYSYDDDFEPETSPVLDPVDEKVTRQQVKSQLRSLGYKDDIPEHILDDFMGELKQAYQEQMDKIIHSELSKGVSSMSIKKEKKQTSPKKAALPRKSSPVKKIVTADTSVTSLKDKNLASIRKTIEQQRKLIEQLETQKTSASLDTSQSIYHEESFVSQSPPKPNILPPRTRLYPSISTTTLPTQRRKKHDPVSRFHQMRNVWQQDKFLKRMGDLNAFKQARSFVTSKHTFKSSSSL